MLIWLSCIVLLWLSFATSCFNAVTSASRASFSVETLLRSELRIST